MLMNDEPADSHRLPPTSPQLRTEFIRVASHELRTPLTSIITFATMLESADDVAAADPADRQAALGAIRRNAEHMQVIVADLLLLSSLETAEAPLDRAPLTCPSCWISRVYRCSCAPGPGPHGRPGAAARAVPHRGPDRGAHRAGRVEAAFADGAWSVVVSAATGTALTAERLLSMRIPHPEQPGEHRTGALALMLGREIAARHGGTMVTSVDRPGVTVRITLPAR